MVYFAGIRTLHLKILARSQKALSFCASSLVFSFSATPLQNFRSKCPFPNPTFDANEILNTAFFQPFRIKCGNLFGFMNKRIEVEVEMDPLPSYVYVDRSFYSLSVDV